MRRMLASVVVTGLAAATLWAAEAPRGPGPSGSPLRSDKPAAAPDLSAEASAKAEVKSPPPASRIDWRTDLDAALKEAAASDRIVLVYFRADWCQPCLLMETGTFARPGFEKYLAESFVPVKADYTTEPGAASRKYQVRAYPSLLFLSSAGEALHMVVGPQTAPQLHAIMERVLGLVKVLAAQKKAPDDLEANFAVGSAYVGLDHLRRAEPYLQRACELDPRNEHGRLSQARLLLAVVPVENGDSALALKNLAAFMEEFKDAPEIPAAMFFQGEILFGDAKMDPVKLLETRGVFDALRTRFPKDVKAYEADRAIDVIDARLKALKKKEKPPTPEKEPPAKPDAI